MFHFYFIDEETEAQAREASPSQFYSLDVRVILGSQQWLIFTSQTIASASHRGSPQTCAHFDLPPKTGTTSVTFARVGSSSFQTVRLDSLSCEVSQLPFRASLAVRFGLSSRMVPKPRVHRFHGD